VLAANYVTSYTYTLGGAPPVLGHTYMLSVGLRTIATTSSTGGAGGLQ
jgi:LPS-assembly protein